MRRAQLTILVTIVVILAACGSGGDDRTVGVTPNGQSTSDGTGEAPKSIVQLGDSVASGEGTLYGYTYDASTMTWTGGNVDAPWPPPYPICHDSPDAYGNHVARYFGATFTQFACTGATFAAGITAPELDDGTPMRPAQFGNWATMTDLNAAYDDAKPDLVLVTLGADDLSFVPIVEACIKNGYEYYFDLADLECTKSNPGATVEKDFFDTLPTVKKDYATLVEWIAARAKANGVPAPKVAFTNYADPLPASGKKCPDTSWLYPQQVSYLASLVAELNSTIISTFEELDAPDVAVVDISEAYEPNGVSHIWCTDDPWAYGLSIYSFAHPSTFESQAPFHPTPAGQESIAQHVIPVVTKLFDAPPPSAAVDPPPTTAARTTAPSSTAPSTAPPTTAPVPESLVRG